MSALLLHEVHAREGQSLSCSPPPPPRPPRLVQAPLSCRLLHADCISVSIKHHTATHVVSQRMNDGCSHCMYLQTSGMLALFLGAMCQVLVSSQMAPTGSLACSVRRSAQTTNGACRC